MKSKNSLSRNKFTTLFEPLKHPLQAIVVGLIIGGVIIALSGFNPFEAIIGMFKGGFGSAYYLTTTLTRSVPIYICRACRSFSMGIGLLKSWSSRTNGFRCLYISSGSC